jgi:indolepyruvate ferredoxin oxidoreductase
VAIRAAVAAGTTMTFKILLNGYISMTGGQASPGGNNLRALRWGRIAAHSPDDLPVPGHDEPVEQTPLAEPVEELLARRSAFLVRTRTAPTRGASRRPSAPSWPRSRSSPPATTSSAGPRSRACSS